MDSNPYEAPQADNPESAKPRPTHLPRRGAKIGAATGASLIPLLAVYTVYQNKSLQGVSEHIHLMIGLTIALSIYGAVFGAAIVATARRFQRWLSPPKS
jgi:hypothetical protein